MRSSEPPVLATWLLEHVRFSNTDEALTGDLLEDFRHGRSVAWYWRQVFAAILVGFLREVRSHWVLAIRAAVIGVTLNCGVLVLGHELLATLYQRRILDLTALPPLGAWIVTSFFSGVVSGWMVALIHRKHRDAMLLTLSGALLVWALMMRGTLLTPRPLRQLMIEVFTFYVFALAGVFVGGFFVSSAPKNATPRNER
jgi:hypothetical protein